MPKCSHFNRSSQIVSGIWVQLQADGGAAGGGGGGEKAKAGLPSPSSDVPRAMTCPIPFPVTAAKTRRKPVGRQASQTKWTTGMAALFVDKEEAGQAWWSVWGLILE